MRCVGVEDQPTVGIQYCSNSCVALGTARLHGLPMFNKPGLAGAKKPPTPTIIGVVVWRLCHCVLSPNPEYIVCDRDRSSDRDSYKTLRANDDSV
ncbi:hypothetical protein ElyMa_003916700 [Elysia marginata]|uniref:Uncharacterized protein n=1 Tax=Elysia marginata TaxID=1093978 RepID=A0AAV4FSJ8_9GAST|nr:hypothetical protein ElyMa_003916700 [Elysia marginata]